MALSVPEYLQSDATELARLVRVGEVSATELLEIAEAQLARLNPKLNAVNLSRGLVSTRCRALLVGLDVRIGERERLVFQAQ